MKTPDFEPRPATVDRAVAETGQDADQRANRANPAPPTSASLLAFDPCAARRAAEIAAHPGLLRAPVRTIRTVRTAADLLDAFQEEAAIATDADAATTAQAEHRAAETLGFRNVDALFSVIDAAWRSAVLAAAHGHGREAPPGWMRDGALFLGAGWGPKALAARWDALALWAAPGPSGAGGGLIAQLHGAQVVTLDHRHATLAPRRIAVLRPTIDHRETAGLLLDDPC